MSQTCTETLASGRMGVPVDANVGTWLCQIELAFLIPPYLYNRYIDVVHNRLDHHRSCVDGCLFLCSLVRMQGELVS